MVDFDVQVSIFNVFNVRLILLLFRISLHFHFFHFRTSLQYSTSTSQVLYSLLGDKTQLIIQQHLTFVMNYSTNLFILLLPAQWQQILTLPIALNKHASPISFTNTKLFYDYAKNDLDLAASSEMDNFSFGGVFESKNGLLSRPYVSQTLKDMDDKSQLSFLSQIINSVSDSKNAQVVDPLWEQIKLEAKQTLEKEPSAGPQLYTLILSQPSFIVALTSIVSHEIETELIPATLLQNLFLEMLDPIDDTKAIALDVMKVANRSSSEIDSSALNAVLFHQGLHALVCHRLSHRLWLAERTGLAYYIQSTGELAL